MRPAPDVQQSDIHPGVGVAALKSDPVVFLKQVGIENDGAVCAIANGHGPRALFGENAAGRRQAPPGTIARRQQGRRNSVRSGPDEEVPAILSH